MKSAAHQHSNRLAREKSPYLLQHAHNPVDWFAWGDEAFAKARVESRPIFLSIGYSTCHWCHVMERESFEDEKVAAFLNLHFVSIKVDREERPDVDKIYMSFVQAATGSGGWPLNVFLTPERKPFYGGTYFPPDNRQGRPGFLQLLQQIYEVWQTRRDEIAGSADEIHARLETAAMSVDAEAVRLTGDALKNAGDYFKRMFDPRHGGFGGAPKFPQPSLPSLLLRCAKRFHDEEAARMVLHTCDRMAAGGIHDQLGGGFARYSVDAEWLVPHFEKMLYDQAQLAQLYLDAHLVSEGRVIRAPDSSSAKSLGLAELAPPKETDFATTARDVLDYVLRDMTHPEGGFYSAEDADSEGHEGKFYCWTHDELSKMLSPEEFNVATRYFGITKEGNFVDHSHPRPLPGQNVLSVVNPLPPAPERSGVSEERRQLSSKGSAALCRDATTTTDDSALLASAKKKMLAARSRRVRPHLDDKILASWNGLMLGAMARAYAVLGDEKYRAAAEKNLAFIQAKLWAQRAADILSAEQTEKLNFRQDAGSTLYHRWRDGERDNVQLLEAYAFLLSGVIDLYEATLQPKHLDFAIMLAEAMVAKFYDAENGGFWQSAADAKDLILHLKDDYDGAEPSGNSVATLTLLKLAAITGREDFQKPAVATLRLFAHHLQNFPQAMPLMLHALDFGLEEPRRVVIAGDPASPKARELLRAAHSVYQPNKVVLGNTGVVEEFARTLPARNGPVAYLCTGNSCQPPTQDAPKVGEMLK
ncbi:MAG: thioredoxin domain-containing protein [Verrucomicrobiota bacterium]